MLRQSQRDVPCATGQHQILLTKVLKGETVPAGEAGAWACFEADSAMLESLTCMQVWAGMPASGCQPTAGTSATSFSDIQ